MRALLATMVLLIAAPVLAKPVVKPLEWGYQGAVFSGYVIYDDASAAIRPGVAMIPDAMGVNDAAIERAKQIAGTDYVVLLVDIYGREIRPANAKQAAAAAKAAYADPDILRGRLVWAIEALRAQGRIAPLDFSQLGAIGFGFGGSMVLELARAGDLEAGNGSSIDGVVSFYGSLRTPAPAKEGAVKTAVLVLNGAKDDTVSADDIAAFSKEMDAAKANWKLVNLEAARHCFTEADAKHSPNCVYNEAAAKRAMALMHSFLAERFKNAPAK